MGIVGILAYVYQFIKRMFLLWRKPTLFNMTVFLSYVSLELMSLVNPGIFCPIPYLLIVTIFFVVVERVHTANISLRYMLCRRRKRTILLTVMTMTTK